MSTLFNKTPRSTDPGYFRIADVVFNVPPTSIEINRVVGNEERIPLRYPTPIYTKTGHARLEAIIRFKVLTDDDYTPADAEYWTEWEKLRRLILMMRVAPFVEIESPHMRQNLADSFISGPLPKTTVLAFALERITVQSSTEILLGLEVEVRLLLFNASPYTPNFRTLNTDGSQAVNMSQSSAFKQYMTNRQASMPGFANSMQQIAAKMQAYEDGLGALKFGWRRYVALPLSPSNSSALPAQTPSLAQSLPTVPAAPVPNVTQTGGVWEWLKYANVSSSTLNDVQALTKAIIQAEGATPTSINAQNAAMGLIQWISGDRVASSAATSDKYYGTSFGQKVKSAGLAGSGSGFNFKTSPGFTATQAAQCFVCGRYKQVQSQSGTTPAPGGWQGLQAADQQALGYGWVNLQFNGSPQSTAWEVFYHHRGQSPDNLGSASTQAYAGNSSQGVIAWWTTAANVLKSLRPDLYNEASTQVPATNSVPTQPSGVLSNSSPTASTADDSDSSAPATLKQQYAALNAILAPKGWHTDSYTPNTAFFYSNESVGTSAGLPGNDSPEVMSQAAVVFSNLFASIPLEAYMFPTLQHLGPAATQVSISMGSVNSAAIGEEPFFPLAKRLSEMSAQLEQQFLAIFPMWRAASSVFLMQKTHVDNLVLNALGISDILVDTISTNTIDESPDLLQVVLSSKQYESEREVLIPYLVAPQGAVLNSTLTSVLSTTNLSQTFTSPGQQNSYKQLMNLNQVLLASSQFQPGQAPDTAANATAIAMYVSNASNSYPSVPMPVSVAAADAQSMVQLNKNSPALSPTTSLYGPQQASPLGQVASRLFANGAVDFTSYYLLTRLGGSGDPNIQALQSKYDPLIAAVQFSASSPQPLVQLLQLTQVASVTNNNTNFERELLQLSRDPTPIGSTGKSFGTMVQDAYNAALPTGDQTQLKGRTGYTDMYISNPAENPYDYFVDYGAKQDTDKSSEAMTIATLTINSSTDLLNQLHTQNGGFSTTGNLKLLAGAGELQTNQPVGNVDPKTKQQRIAAIVNQTDIPWHSMKRAFPTFKLFLVEDDNFTPFYLYDNFYTYAAVLDINIIQYRMQPDLAEITISDTGHQLQHMLYDNSTAGVWERELSLERPLSNSPAGEPNYGPGGGRIDANVDRFSGQVTQDPVGFDGYFHNSPVKTPLKYFALQTGSKIQVRMGFSNHPDAMTPVFQGLVTEIEPGDQIRIVAQGFNVELDVNTGETLSSDGHWHLNVLNHYVETAQENWDSVFERSKGITLSDAASQDYQDISSALHGKLAQGASFGGFSVLPNSGEGDSVMLRMLQSAGAKHFGHWSIATPEIDPFLQGFTWTKLLPKSISNKLGYYDRSGDNLRLFTIPQAWYDQAPFWGIPQTYYIKNDEPVTPWQIITDIAKRYPELILMVRPYGYPDQVDATLVFADPVDVYTARYPNPQDIGMQLNASAPPTKSDNQLFQQWWALNRYTVKKDINLTIAPALNGYIPLEFGTDGTKEAYASMGAGGGNLSSFLSTLTTWNQQFKTLYSTIFDLLDRNRNRRAQKTIVGLQESWAAFQEQQALSTASAAANQQSRFKPVRRYHLVDYDCIIHNGIKRNDKWNNAVRLGDGVFQINGHIQPHDIRLFDATGQVLYPEENIRLGSTRAAVADWFLKDEVGKMYEGEIVLAGNPDIKPYDVLLLNDTINQLYGPVEVDKVVHTFSQDTGMITIVTPRTLVTVNGFSLLGLGDSILSKIKEIKDSYTGGNSEAQVNASLQVGLEAVGVGLGVAAGVLFGSWIVGAVGVVACAVAIGGATVGNSQNAARIIVSPLSWGGYPYVAGMNGYAMTDFVNSLWSKAQEAYYEELRPTIAGLDAILKTAGSSR